MFVIQAKRKISAEEERELGKLGGAPSATMLLTTRRVDVIRLSRTHMLSISLWLPLEIWTTDLCPHLAIVLWHNRKEAHMMIFRSALEVMVEVT
jgi:hypothetical protein